MTFTSTSNVPSSTRALTGIHSMSEPRTSPSESSHQTINNSARPHPPDAPPDAEAADAVAPADGRGLDVDVGVILTPPCIFCIDKSY